VTRGGVSRTKCSLSLALVSAFVGISLSVTPNLATGAETCVRASVRQHCSVSIDNGIATVRSNVPWEVGFSASDGATDIVRGGPTDGQRIAIPAGSRVEMVPR